MNHPQAPKESPTASQRYQIQGKLGQGGVGLVYRAYDTVENREVAIKRILPEGDDEDIGLATNTGSASIMKEALILSSMEHPSIVSVFDIGEDEDGIYLVMESVNGNNIDEQVDHSVFTLDDFYRFANQVLSGLAYAGTKGLQHRDLKPSNLMLSWDSSGSFQTKILDFGLAKVAPAPALQTMDHQGAILGSIYFMAPEQFERAELDQRTDLYSFGCVCYYALTGKYPFAGEHPAIVMASHLEHNVKPINEFRSDIPQALSDWVMWLIARKIEDRPNDAQTALQYLQQVQQQPFHSFSQPTRAIASEPPQVPSAEPEPAPIPEGAPKGPIGPRGSVAKAVVNPSLPKLVRQEPPLGTSTTTQVQMTSPRTTTVYQVQRVENNKRSGAFLATLTVSAMVLGVIAGIFIFKMQ